MRRLLATTTPLNYGSMLLGKSHASLKRLAAMGKIILTHGHEGQGIGEVTKLQYKRTRDGIGQLWGEIADTLDHRSYGLSLQYAGVPIGSRISITPGEDTHVALVSDPRDQLTLLDGAKKTMIFKDSATDENQAQSQAESTESDTETNTGTDQTATATGITADNATGTEAGTEMGTTIEVDPDDLVSAIVGSQPHLDALVAALVAHPSIAELLKQPATKSVTGRVIVAPKVPEKQQTTPRMVQAPAQQPLRPTA